MKPVNLLCLDPVTYASTKEELDYMRRHLSKDTVLDTKSIANGPETIESGRDEVIAAPQVLKACLEAEKSGYDGVFINCFADPGLEAVREALSIPVFGGFEPAISMSLAMGDRIGVLTVSPKVLTMLNRLVAKFGVQNRIVDIRSIDIPVLELVDKERLCAALLDEAVKGIKESGVQAYVLGCTAMVDVADNLQQMLKEEGYDIPVLESAQCSLFYLEACVKMGLKHSALTYIPAKC